MLAPVKISLYTLRWAFLATYIAHQRQSMLQSHQLCMGRLGAVTLAASKLVIQIKEAQKASLTVLHINEVFSR